MVKGKVKGSGYRLGEPVKAMNDYCIVYVDGSWRIVDPHRGSQYVIATVDRNDDWEALDGSGAGQSGGESSDEAAQHEIGQYCDEFYFLTDPVAFVYTHLTLDPACQVAYVNERLLRFSHRFATVGEKCSFVTACFGL